MKKPKVEPSGIRLDEWLKAVDAANAERVVPSKAVTIQEFADMLGCGRGSAMYKMKRLVASGRATQTKKTLMRTSGIVYTATAYLLAKDPPKKK